LASQADVGFTPTLRSPDETWPGHRGWKAERKLEAEDRSEHPETGRARRGTAMKGYVVVFEGDDTSGYSAYSPDLPGVVAAGSSREETEILMREAMIEHITLLAETGQSVPEPATSAHATIMNIPAA
jgi:predicted RNase H-like HicB family nuclease